VSSPALLWLRRCPVLPALLALAALGTVSVTGARAQAPAPVSSTTATATAADVKAAYLYKFLAYVEWPPTAFADAEAALVIGVAGDEAVQASLEAITANRRERGHPIEVRRLPDGDPPEPLHVVFIGRALNASRWLARLKDRPVLLVTDQARGLEAGAMLNFVPVEGRIRFEASLARARQSGLHLGARLLSVAERVVMP